MLSMQALCAQLDWHFQPNREATMDTRAILLVVFATLPAAVAGQPAPPPIIDMHLHAVPYASQGPPPLGFCANQAFPAATSGTEWPAIFMSGFKDPPCEDPIWSPESDQELRERTQVVMERRNVYGLTSGDLVDAWKTAMPERVIPSLMFGLADTRPPIDSLRAWFQRGRYAALAEVWIQYQGRTPDDSAFAPYLALAEELDVPVGIHIGTGPPGAPYLGFGAYRAALHSPLLLEPVLVRHPKLRIFIMHAGWPMLDDLLAVMWAHPQVYVDVGIISYGLPRKAFHRYLERIVEAGFGQRVMFGSDQMVWPEALERAIQAIESAAFLSAQQQRDILYENAARFLRLSDDERARHHGR
jgi:hypothetical protein